MTADDRPEQPGRPTSADRGSTPTDPAEGRLRAALDAAATQAGPAPDDWADVLARADGTHVALTAAAGSGRTTSRRSRERVRTIGMAAVAAALTLLVGTALVLAATTDDDDATVTAGPTDADEPTGPTGWYVPSPLPAGWTVERIDLESRTLNCPCHRRLWASDEGGHSLLYVREPEAGAATVPGAGARDVDLGGGVVGSLEGGDGRMPTVSWREAGDRRLLHGVALSADEVIDIARRIRGGPDPTDSPIADFVEEPGTALDAEVQIESSVVVRLRSATGLPHAYTLSPRSGPGTGHYSSYLGTSGVDDAGGPLYDGTEGNPTSLDQRPGATVLLHLDGPTYYRPEIPPSPSEQELETLATGLQPATTETWADFLDSAEQHDPALDGVARLADLEDGSAPEAAPPRSSSPEGTVVEPTTTTTAPTTTTTTTTPGEAGGAGLEVRVDPAEVVIDEGDEVRVRISIENASAVAVPVSPCFPSSLEWGLEQDGRSVGLSGGRMTSCASGSADVAPGESLEVTNGGPGDGVRIAAKDPDGADLPAGRYDAVITVEGLVQRIVVPVVIRG